eukprot:768579-Hanusia_phi.AAC.1
MGGKGTERRRRWQIESSDGGRGKSSKAPLEREGLRKQLKLVSSSFLLRYLSSSSHRIVLEQLVNLLRCHPHNGFQLEDSSEHGRAEQAKGGGEGGGWKCGQEQQEKINEQEGKMHRSKGRGGGGREARVPAGDGQGEEESSKGGGGGGGGGTWQRREIFPVLRTSRILLWMASFLASVSCSARGRGSWGNKGWDGTSRARRGGAGGWGGEKDATSSWLKLGEMVKKFSSRMFEPASPGVLDSRRSSWSEDLRASQRRRRRGGGGGGGAGGERERVGEGEREGGGRGGKT